jgi:hypothetical protein
MSPPISKSLWFFFLHLFVQKNTATPIMKQPATPDTTETPITVPGLVPLLPLLPVAVVDEFVGVAVDVSELV